MEQPIEGICTLESLPLDVFFIVARQLSPVNLAALSVQSRRLRDQASCNDIWKPHCLGWWPHAATAVELYYSGDWHKMFSQRAAMPPAFPAAVDKIHLLTMEARESSSTLSPKRRLRQATEPNTAIEEILRGVEAAKRAVQMKADISYSAEFERLQIDVSWWLAEHPQAAIKFAKAASERFYVNMSTGQGRISSRCDAEWKLDALEGLTSLALEQRVHLSVRRRLDAEVSTLRKLVEAPA